MEDQDNQNSQTRNIAIGIVAVLAVGAGAWWYWQRPATTAAPVAVVADDAAVATVDVDPPAAIRHPLSGTEPDPAATETPGAVTAVDADATAATGLGTLFGETDLAAWLIPDSLVRRLVATTDNLSRDARIEPQRPLRAPAGPITVERELLDATVGSERIVLSPQNASRYDVPVGLLVKTDMAQAANLYRELYPLLQRAYEDLGYPDRYFNDRVVDTIDHLLATPEPEGPLLLEQPKVLYRFADADLEARSPGQKLLLRMGNDHARTVKQKLREFRGQISSKE